MHNNIFNREKVSFLPTYKRIPIEIVKGKGVYLFDNDGNRYLDFISGLGVNALGYAHPKIIEAVTSQVKKLSHLSNYFITEIQVEFAEKLLKYACMDKVFLTNSGTEAIEGVIKLIRMKFGPKKKIFSLTNSFHGRTYGSLSLTAREKHRVGFEPLLPNISHINFDDIKDLELKINEDTAAIFLEFIQGEGGVNPISENFVQKLFHLRTKYNFLIVADEIQSGVGRTGKNFAFQHYNVDPDVIVSAKAIGGGLPLGAFLVNEELSFVFDYGKHGTTFGGNPIACSAGNAVLNYITKNNLNEKIEKLSKYFYTQLNILKDNYPNLITDLRGKGLIIGIEVTKSGDKIVEQLRMRKILANLTADNVIRMLPPLIVEKEHIDIFLNKFDEILTNLSD